MIPENRDGQSSLKKMKTAAHHLEGRWCRLSFLAAPAQVAWAAFRNDRL